MPPEECPEPLNGGQHVNGTRAAEMFALYSEGMSLRQVGKRFGVSGTTVNNTLRGAGYPLRTYEESMALYRTQGGGVPPALAGSTVPVAPKVLVAVSVDADERTVPSPERREDAPARVDPRARPMYERYLDGRSLAEIGREWGLTRERIRQIFKRAGLPTRGKAAAAEVRRQRRPEGDAPVAIDASKILAEVRLAFAVRHYETSGRIVESAAAGGVNVRTLRRRLVRDGYPLPPTPRQRVLLEHLADHRSRREIAALMGLSRQAVVAELSTVLEKTRAADRQEAVRVARQCGWL